MLVVGHTQTITEQGVEISPGHVAPLHIHPKDSGSCADDVRLPKVFSEVRLYERDAVHGCRLNQIVPGAARDAVADIHCADVLSPSTADTNRDVTGVRERGQRGSDEHIPLFQFPGKERLSACDARRIHCKGLCTALHGV